MSLPPAPMTLLPVGDAWWCCSNPSFWSALRKVCVYPAAPAGLSTCHPASPPLPAAGADLEAGAPEAEGFHDAVEQGGLGSFRSIPLSHDEDASEEQAGKRA